MVSGDLPLVPSANKISSRSLPRLPRVNLLSSSFYLKVFPWMVSKDDPEGKEILGGEWEEGDKDMVLKSLKEEEVEARPGQPVGH